MASIEIPSAFDSSRQSRTSSLRVGVLIESLTPTSWVRQILDDILSRSDFELVLIVAHKPCGAALQNSRTHDVAWHRIYRNRRLGFPDAFATEAIVPGHYASNVIQLSQEAGTNFEVPSNDDLAAIGAAHLDVILNLGESGLNYRLDGAAKYGTWAFDVDENGRAGNAWSCDARCVSTHHRQDVVATEIRVQSGKHQGTTVGCLFSCADPTNPFRGANTLYWKRSALLMQRLIALRNNGWDFLVSQESGIAKRSTVTSPSIAGMAAFTLRSFGIGFVNHVRRALMREQWFIALRRVPENSELTADMSGFSVVRPPMDRFYADPFLIQENGGRYIFLEIYRYSRRKGVIACIPVDERGNCGPEKIVLEAPYHLSYPFLFRWQGQIYMMPETSEVRRIEVFRAVQFPHRWEPHAVLMDNIVAFDPTLIQHEGKFWLFVSGVLKHGSENSALCVFWAESPFGEWHPHPGNPVVYDVRRARPAGAIYELNGQLFRPAQDCSGIYGHAITLNRIEVLTETAYREVPVTRIESDWLPGNIGTHTFNHDGSFQVIDGRVLMSKLRLFGRQRRGSNVAYSCTSRANSRAA